MEMSRGGLQERCWAGDLLDGLQGRTNLCCATVHALLLAFSALYLLLVFSATKPPLTSHWPCLNMCLYLSHTYEHADGLCCNAMAPPNFPKALPCLHASPILTCTLVWRCICRFGTYARSCLATTPLCNHTHRRAT